MDRLTLSSGYNDRRQVLEVDLDRTRMADIYDWCMDVIPDQGEEHYRLPQNAPATSLTLVRRGAAMDLLLTGKAEGAEPPLSVCGIYRSAPFQAASGHTRAAFPAGRAGFPVCPGAVSTGGQGGGGYCRSDAGRAPHDLPGIPRQGHPAAAVAVSGHADTFRRPEDFQCQSLTHIPLVPSVGWNWQRPNRLRLRTSTLP